MSKSKNSTGLVKILGIVALVFLAFAACATYDSCKRLNRDCFGVTGTR